MNKPALYVTSFASISAIIVGASYALWPLIGSNSLMTEADTEELTSAQVPTVEAATQSADGEASQAPGQIAAQVHTSGMYMKFSVPDSGTYVLSAPTVSGGRIVIDGAVVVDTTRSTTPAGHAAPFSNAFIALSAGAHVIEISGAFTEESVLSQITIGVLGLQSASLAQTATNIDRGHAQSILEMIEN